MSTSSLLRLALTPALATLLVGCALDDAEPDLINIESSPRPHFEVFENEASGQYAFRFAGEDGETLLDSKWYESRIGALGGVVSVLDNGGLAPRYEVVAEGGGYGIELSAGNGWVIAKSDLYASEEAAERGVDSIIAAVAEYLAFQHQRTGARFEISEDSIGRYHFALYGDDGSPLLSSQHYSSEAAALNGAFSTRENGVLSERYQTLEAPSGGYYLELRARNGRTLAESPVLASRSEAEATREAIRELLVALPVI